MTVRPRTWWAMTLGLVAMLCATLAVAADNIAELKEKLLKAEDFRVRTQAALALGATESEQAVDPLCLGLKDGNDTVRAAVAAALGKLQKGGVECLKNRLKDEKADNVKKMIEKAIRLIEEAASGPAITASTKYYVAVGKTDDQSGRGGNEVDSLVRSTMKKSAGAIAGCVVAPDGETEDQAKRRMRKNEKIAGYYLSPKLYKPEYSGGQLSIKLDLLMFSYPDRALQGSLTREAGMPASAKDVATENRLIQALAESAIEEFGKLAAQVD